MHARHQTQLRKGGVRERTDGVDATTEKTNHVEWREDRDDAHGVSPLVRLEHGEATAHAHLARDGSVGGRHVAWRRRARRAPVSFALQSRVALVDGERRGGLDARRVRRAGSRRDGTRIARVPRNHARVLAFAASLVEKTFAASRVEKSVRDDVEKGRVVAVAAEDEFSVGGGANGREGRREEILGDEIELLHSLFAGARVGVRRAGERGGDAGDERAENIRAREEPARRAGGASGRVRGRGFGDDGGGAFATRRWFFRQSGRDKKKRCSSRGASRVRRVRGNPRESEGIRGNEGASSELAAGVPVEVRVRLVHEWRGEDAVSRELRHGAAHGIVARELHDRGGGTRV